MHIVITAKVFFTKIGKKFLSIRHIFPYFKVNLLRLNLLQHLTILYLF